MTPSDPKGYTHVWDSEGNQIWLDLNGNKHRLDGPAVVTPEGRLEWWSHGKRFREGGEPNVVTSEGIQEWWGEDGFHRVDDLPARIYPDGTQEWWSDGKRHREGDQPSVDSPSGEKYYHQNGVLHRDDGPAILYMDGTEEYWQKGLRHRDTGPAVVGPERREWWQRGERFRADDLPVVETEGDEFEEACDMWMVGDKLHRENNLPAVIYEGGKMSWWLDGKRHRTDGPAVVDNGVEEYWIDDKQLSEEEFHAR